MDDHMYEQIPLTELRDKAGLGKIGDKVAETGEPIVVTRQGRPHFLIAPLQLLRPDALPPAYFDREQQARDAQNLAADLAERFDPHTIREAMEWAENADDPAHTFHASSRPADDSSSNAA